MRQTRGTFASLLVVATLAISLLFLFSNSTQLQAQVADSDGDGVSDSIEATYGSDPNSARSTPEALGYAVPTCSDGIDNDLDGATDSADSGCVLIISTATPAPTVTPTPTPTPEATATLPPITTATPAATATTPPITQPTAAPTQPGISSGGPGGDPTAPPPGGDFQAIDPTTKPGIGLPPFPDLRITDLELTQGIQDLENRIPLVDNRITYLRVYVATDEGNWGNVDAVLGAFRNGQQLGLTENDNDPAVLFAWNGAITATEDGGDRVNLDDSLYFRLPRHWTHGTTTFRVLAYGNGNPNSVDSEPDPDNNLRDLQRTFELGQDAHLMLVPIHLHNGSVTEGAVETYTWNANEDEATNAVNDVFRLNPVARLLVYGGELEEQVWPLCHNGWCDMFASFDSAPREWDLSEPTQVGLPNVRISLLKDNTDPWVDDLGWYGMVANDTTMTFQSAGFDPINISGLASNGVSYGKMGDSYWNGSPWHVSRGATLAHELAHNLGLSHVSCSGTEAAGGPIDGNYPYPNPDCSIANVDPAGYYGLDVYYKTWSWLTEPAVISNDPAAADPSNGFPLMGYQSPKWIDPYDYCLMLVGYGIDCDLNDLQISVPNALREAFVATADAIRAGQLHAGHDHAPTQPHGTEASVQTADQFALVYGYIDHDANEAIIQFVQRIDDPLPHVINEAIAREAQRAAAGPVDYVLALRDPSGNIVGELPLVDFNVPNHAGPNAIQIFAELVIWPGDVSTIEVNDASGDLLVARPVSASAPIVQITSPAAGDDVDAPLQLTWDASDPDGDPLLAMVQYSADAGATWRVVADTIVGNSVEIASFGFMPATDGQGIFRVTMNDGVNTGRDEVGNLSVPNGGPTPRILGPGNGHSALQGEIVSLDGTATDWEDGTIEGESLTWSSDIDGDLGHGETFDTVSLSPGQHTITFAAEDSDGAVGESTIILTVRETLRPDRTAELRAAAARLGITLPDPPSDDSAFDVTSLGIGAAAGAVLMMILAVFVGRLRARPRD